MSESVGHRRHNLNGFHVRRTVIVEPFCKARAWKKLGHDEATFPRNGDIVHRNNSGMPELRQGPSLAKEFVRV